jgi:acyl-CoA hydrolase
MDTIKQKKTSESFTIMTEMIMPNDTNPINNLMGGNLLRWMDIAGGICAGKHCERYVVTASVDNVSFAQPIRLGDVITIEASVSRAFTSSVEIYVEVFASDIRGFGRRRCNNAYYTFVALNPDDLKPIKDSVPELIPETDEQRERFAGAMRRRELRLVLAGRMKPSEATHLREIFD